RPRLALRPARIEVPDGIAEAGGRKRLGLLGATCCVGAHDAVLGQLESAGRERRVVALGPGVESSNQRERLAERRNRLEPDRRIPILEVEPPPLENLIATDHLAGLVDDTAELRGVQLAQRLDVSRGDRCLQAFGVRRGAVRADPPEHGRPLRAARRTTVEARERELHVPRLEMLETREQTVRAEPEELYQPVLDQAGALAIAAADRTPREQRVALEGEDLLDGSLDDLEQPVERDVPTGDVVAPHLAEADSPMVDVAEVGRERVSEAAAAAGEPEHRRDGARGGGRAIALRARGQLLGVAVVEARDRVGQPVGTEDFGASRAS